MKKLEIKIDKVLRRLISDARITTTLVSRKTGVPNSTLSTWLIPGAKPRDPLHVAAVASFFQVSLEYLLFDSSPPSMRALLLGETILDGKFRLRIERMDSLPEAQKEEMNIPKGMAEGLKEERMASLEKQSKPIAAQSPKVG